MLLIPVFMNPFPFLLGGYFAVQKFNSFVFTKQLFDKHRQLRTRPSADSLIPSKQ